MNPNIPETFDTSEAKYKPELLAGPTNEAFLKYGPTEVVVYFGRNAQGEIVIQHIEKKDGVSSTDTNPTQPFPKYLQNSTTFTFMESKTLAEGPTLEEFFGGVLLHGNADIRDVAAATKLLLLENQDKFEGVKDPENIRHVYNTYYDLMIYALNVHANNPKTAEKYPEVHNLMSDLIEIFKANGPLGILQARKQAAGSAEKYTLAKESDEWMTTDENGVYNAGGGEVLSFTHTGDLYNNGVLDLTNFKVGLNLEYVPAAQNLQIILTGGGVQRFSDPTRHEKIFRGKDGTTDEKLKAKIMNFYNNIIAAKSFLERNGKVLPDDTPLFADLICTVVMEVLQETGKDIIPSQMPELTEANLGIISDMIADFTTVSLNPNPEITTVTTSIIFPKMTGKVPNWNNTADEILDPLTPYVNLEELLILIDQGIIEDQRLIAAAGIYLAKHLYNLG
jgi:hypothetical protein